MVEEAKLKEVEEWMAGVLTGSLVYNRDAIGRYEEEDLVVDTCWAPVEEHFETAVSDLRYGGGSCWIIVESYGERDAAIRGHACWVKTLIGATPPAQLVDIDIYKLGIEPYKLGEEGEDG